MQQLQPPVLAAMPLEWVSGSTPRSRCWQWGVAGRGNFTRHPSAILPAPYVWDYIYPSEDCFGFRHLAGISEASQKWGGGTALVGRIPFPLILI